MTFPTQDAPQVWDILFTEANLIKKECKDIKERLCQEGLGGRGLTGYLWSSVTSLKMCVGLLGSTMVSFLGCRNRTEVAGVELQFI